MWDEALQHIVGCWTNDEYEFDGKYWQMPPRRVHPKPLQKPHPPIWGATSSVDGHYEIGQARHRPAVVHRRHPAREARGAHRESTAEGLADCTQPVGKFVNDHGRDVHDGALQRHQREGARRSPRSRSCGTSQTAATTASRRCRVDGREKRQELGNYGYAGEALQRRAGRHARPLDMDYLYDSGAGVVGDPDACIEICKRYEAVGCELLFCLLNPYNIPHERSCTRSSSSASTSSPRSARRSWWRAGSGEHLLSERQAVDAAVIVDRSEHQPTGA